MPDPHLKARMSRAVPARKVTVASLASALTSLALWGLKNWGMDAADDPEISGAIATVIFFAVPFLVGYLVPPSPHDGIDTYSASAGQQGPAR